MSELGRRLLARGFIRASLYAERDDVVSGVQQCYRNHRKSFPLRRQASESPFNYGLRTSGEIDPLSRRIGGAVEILPGAFDFDVVLIDTVRESG